MTEDGLAGSLLALESALHTRPHPVNRDDLRTMTALAAGYFARARLADALTVLDDVAERTARILGPHDPDTLVVRGNLAVTHAALEHGREAVELLHAAVADRTRVFGEQHPATLTARDALAVTHRLTGDHDAACALHARVVVERTRVLGAAHPDTLVSRLGAARAEEEADRPGYAVDILDGALRDAESVPGLRPGLLTALRAALGYCLADLGRIPEAVAMLRHAASGDGEPAPDDIDITDIRRALRHLELLHP